MWKSSVIEWCPNDGPASCWLVARHEMWFHLCLPSHRPLLSKVWTKPSSKEKAKKGAWKSKKREDPLKSRICGLAKDSTCKYMHPPAALLWGWGGEHLNVVVLGLDELLSCAVSLSFSPDNKTIKLISCPNFPNFSSDDTPDRALCTLQPAPTGIQSTLITSSLWHCHHLLNVGYSCFSEWIKMLSFGLSDNFCPNIFSTVLSCFSCCSPVPNNRIFATNTILVFVGILLCCSAP